MPTAEVPTRFQVGVNGRGYLVDTASGDWLERAIALLRPQQDGGDEPTERSLDPEALWRRSQESWHLGAGQRYFDRAGSSRSRFRTSKGIDPWTTWQLTLQRGTAQRKTFATSGLLCVVGDYLYLYDVAANKLFYTTSAVTGALTWTEVTGLSATLGGAIATDGYNVYIAQGVNGIYRTTRGAATATSWVTGSVNFVGWVKGRLMAAYANNLYNVTAAGALPAALLAHFNTDFIWFGFAEGPSNIYTAGFSGDKGRIYRTAIRPDGTALDIPVQAGELPDGERAYGICGYLGFMMIGTSLGVRFATIDPDGDLNIGSLIETTGGNDNNAPLFFEPQGSYIWFGWGNYDGTSSGLGRISVQDFVDAEKLLPAYASDLMATGQGQVQSVVTYQDKRVFTVVGLGVYAETEAYVTSGTIDSGYITFGLPDEKVAMLLDCSYQGTFVGSHAASSSVDDGAFALISTHTEGGSLAEMAIAQQRGERFELRSVLSRGATNTTAPVLSRWTLKAEVTFDQGENVFLPLLLASEESHGTAGYLRDVEAEIALLKALRSGRPLVTYQIGSLSYIAVVRDMQITGRTFDDQNRTISATCTLKLKVLREGTV